MIFIYIMLYVITGAFVSTIVVGYHMHKKKGQENIPNQKTALTAGVGIGVFWPFAIFLLTVISVSKLADKVVCAISDVLLE